MTLGEVGEGGGGCRGQSEGLLGEGLRRRERSLTSEFLQEQRGDFKTTLH